MDLNYKGMALLPVMVGINEAIKALGVKTKYIPLINLIIGILFGIFFYPEDIKIGVLNGIYLALSASGLFSSSKHIYKEFKKDTNKDENNK